MLGYPINIFYSTLYKETGKKGPEIGFSGPYTVGFKAYRSDLAYLRQRPYFFVALTQADRELLPLGYIFALPHRRISLVRSDKKAFEKYGFVHFGNIKLGLGFTTTKVASRHGLTYAINLDEYVPGREVIEAFEEYYKTFSDLYKNALETTKNPGEAYVLAMQRMRGHEAFERFEKLTKVSHKAKKEPSKAKLRELKSSWDRLEPGYNPVRLIESGYGHALFEFGRDTVYYGPRGEHVVTNHEASTLRSAAVVARQDGILLIYAPKGKKFSIYDALSSEPLAEEVEIRRIRDILLLEYADGLLHLVAFTKRGFEYFTYDLKREEKELKVFERPLIVSPPARTNDGFIYFYQAENTIKTAESLEAIKEASEGKPDFYAPLSVETYDTGKPIWLLTRIEGTFLLYSEEHIVVSHSFESFSSVAPAMIDGRKSALMSTNVRAFILGAFDEPANLLRLAKEYAKALRGMFLVNVGFKMRGRIRLSPLCGRIHECVEGH